MISWCEKVFKNFVFEKSIWPSLIIKKNRLPGCKPATAAAAVILVCMAMHSLIPHFLLFVSFLLISATIVLKKYDDRSYSINVTTDSTISNPTGNTPSNLCVNIVNTTEKDAKSSPSSANNEKSLELLPWYSRTNYTVRCKGAFFCRSKHAPYTTAKIRLFSNTDRVDQKYCSFKTTFANAFNTF